MPFVKILRVLVVLILLGCVGLYGADYLGADRFEQRHQDLLKSMHHMADQTATEQYKRTDLADLPPLVRQYLEKAAPLDQPKAELTRVWQKGRIKTTEDSSWSDFEAREHITLSTRQMVWAAKADLAPLTKLYILTSKLTDSARVDSWLWGLLEVSDRKGQVIRAYLMLRWLAEAVWHPHALLPGPDLKWERTVKKIGSGRAARVSLTQDGITVSGTFLFAASKGAPFFFLADPGPFAELRIRRFFCRYSDWRKEQGTYIPFRMEQGTRYMVSDRSMLEIELLKLEKP
ncbi:DUF6544 family protein [Dethiosulfatarculus sandiegensis]|uniref:Uncharacterized protein n=1 Tax=Dethiosulfatarculus sandiegensis TaxID=1429043 RepID=A0A0D2GG16_9BACT|nr:DUF6544 family protein [Dethiosulfatarculus sandiegensis]KIX13867.1 hypothetical protein X474_11480 [Dethiosulfatarculus sandiegensis]